MEINWPALTTVGAAFAGATCAQVLAHLFTLRRESLLRKQAVSRYIEHIKFDYVLAVSTLETILNRASLVTDADEFDWGKGGTYKRNYGSLMEKLDFDMNVSPRFMFNARKWFALYNQEIARFDTPEATEAKRVQLNALNQTMGLYVWGLGEIVNADRRNAPRRLLRKKAYVDGEPTYDDILAAYKKTGYPPPDRKTFEVCLKLRQRFRESVEGKAP